MNCPLCTVMLQVGACIVNKEKKIVGIGYNGMPNRCSDDELPWRRTHDSWLETKYPYGWWFYMCCSAQVHNCMHVLCTVHAFKSE